MATRLTLAAVIPQISDPIRPVYSMPPLVSITPLGTPVVPEVYNSSATSPGAPGPPGSVVEAALRQASYSAPSSRVVACSTPAAGSKSRSVAPTMISFGVESAAMAAISGAASRQLSPTTIAPILLHPNTIS